MDRVYIDESIHANDGFILSSFVAGPKEVDDMIREKISEVGLTPDQDEFKSGTLLHNRGDLQLLRRHLLSIVVSKCKLALLLTPSSQRRQLGHEVLSTAVSLVTNNRLNPTSLEFFVDQGIFAGRPTIPHPLRDNSFYYQADSKKVPGLQLSDLVAHYCSYRLVEKLRGPKKFTFVGPNEGYDPGFNVELGWIFRTQLRFNFFMEDKDVNMEGGDDFFWREVNGYGAFFSDNLDPVLKSAAIDVFGHTWIGCIH